MIYEIIFWIAVISQFYTYGGYWIFLRIVILFRSRDIMKSSYFPNVTILISAYNEADIIEEKIQNTLSLNYPKSKMEIIVVSDASSDDTDKIVRKYSEKGITLERYEGRIGKTGCLNKVMTKVKGEIVVFSDANSCYNEEAIKNIAKNFADGEVGCVTGWTLYTNKKDVKDNKSIGLYSRIEKKIKIAESLIGSCVGADGAIFAIRKECYSQLSDYDINDFVIPIRIVAKGYRTIFEEKAYCWEDTTSDIHGEFERQVRITNRTIRALWNNRYLFKVPQYKLFSIQLFSHKFLKYLSPLMLLAIIVSNIVVVVLDRGLIYKYVLILQLGIYIFAIIPNKMVKISILRKINSFIRTFVYMNLAMAKGWYTFLKGDEFVTWKSLR